MFSWRQSWRILTSFSTMSRSSPSSRLMILTAATWPDWRTSAFYFFYRKGQFQSESGSFLPAYLVNRAIAALANLFLGLEDLTRVTRHNCAHRLVEKQKTRGGKKPYSGSGPGGSSCSSFPRERWETRCRCFSLLPRPRRRLQVWTL